MCIVLHFWELVLKIYDEFLEPMSTSSEQKSCKAPLGCLASHFEKESSPKTGIQSLAHSNSLKQSSFGMLDVLQGIYIYILSESLMFQNSTSSTIQIFEHLCCSFSFVLIGNMKTKVMQPRLLEKNHKQFSYRFGLSNAEIVSTFCSV